MWRALIAFVLIFLFCGWFTALAVAAETVDLSTREQTALQYGAADAVVADRGSVGAEPKMRPFLTAAQVTALLPEGSRVMWLDSRTWDGEMVIDMRDRLTRGMFTLVSGRFPEKEGEAVVQEGVGPEVLERAREQWTVVGTMAAVERSWYPQVVVLGWLPTEPDEMDWLVEAGPAGIGPDVVRRLEQAGLDVRTRAALLADDEGLEWRALPSPGFLGGALVLFVAVLVLQPHASGRKGRVWVVRGMVCAAVPLGVGAGIAVAAWGPVGWLAGSEQTPGAFDVPVPQVLTVAAVSFLVALLVLLPTYRRVTE
ncbi:hypothetical protein ACIBG7_29785 [Nonomuraea sp. NPDC050328]|uniref:hypothetical protein n=1 Tax=Nonomuraea sp. NPDC050328 TaxID=3364361 RepID=UPI0037B680EF